jgi:hypothetical protein
MINFFKYLATAALLIASMGQASASSTITEDLTVFYTSPSGFTISNLFFGTSGSNLISLANQNWSPATGGTHVNLFSQTISIDTSQQYTFSFGGTYSGSNNAITITGTSQSFGAFQSPDGLRLFISGGALAPVPLPAS